MGDSHTGTWYLLGLCTTVWGRIQYEVPSYITVAPKEAGKSQEIGDNIVIGNWVVVGDYPLPLRDSRNPYMIHAGRPRNTALQVYDVFVLGSLLCGKLRWQDLVHCARASVQKGQDRR